MYKKKFQMKFQVNKNTAYCLHKLSGISSLMNFLVLIIVCHFVYPVMKPFIFTGGAGLRNIVLLILPISATIRGIVYQNAVSPRLLKSAVFYFYILRFCFPYPHSLSSNS
ncbi:hypothetical protein EGR_05676 [Echinococcus granulosus]|uniref:Uncharacterized protein n=1 Tax=Echinococcus granulosus TaxID=6210 RepID=W6UDK7_ECHGR|nr:hypothetical protein EGR_05676 [Echinococcus granulosus]EUB59425.1 hypothetical protein EGR_05676 [Echinococcus granulosus]